MDKRILMVVGHESSGTRLATKILIACGCHGDAEHEQEWDKSLPDVSPAVWRRSLPHRREWPDIWNLLRPCIEDGFSPSLVVCTRDWRCSALSQVAAHHARTVEEAEENIRKARISIHSQMVSMPSMPWVELCYEELCAKPLQTSLWLADRLSLPPPQKLPRIRPANAKYAGSDAAKEE